MVVSWWIVALLRSVIFSKLIFGIGSSDINM